MANVPLRAPPGVLTMVTVQQADTYVVRLSGEMDGSNASELEDELVRIEEIEGSRIVLDLVALEFIDSTGLAVVFRAHCRAVENNHGLAIRLTRGPVSRIIEFCGLTEVLPVVTVRD